MKNTYNPPQQHLYTLKHIYFISASFFLLILLPCFFIWKRFPKLKSNKIRTGITVHIFLWTRNPIDLYIYCQSTWHTNLLKQLQHNCYPSYFCGCALSKDVMSRLQRHRFSALARALKLCCVWVKVVSLFSEVHKGQLGVRCVFMPHFLLLLPITPQLLLVTHVSV